MAPIANLQVRISAQIAELQTEFKNASKSASDFAGDFEGIATRAAAVGTFIGNIAKDMTYALVQGFGQGLKDAVKASGEMQSAMIGLDSVAAAFGHNVTDVRNAARSLTADGLLPMKDAAAGLKNLLSTGFSLDQATTLMNAFKDSAAFGRQGSLDFGDAIVRATEGIKNGNSALADNAGLTKNLSNILVEAGFKASDLSKVQSDLAVRTALYTGALREMSVQTGDAAKYANTYMGQISRLNSAYTVLLATVGDSITTNATAAKAIRYVSDNLLNLTDDLGKNKKGYLLVSDTIIFFVKALGQTVRALDIVQQAFHTFVGGVNNIVRALAEAVAFVFKVAEAAANLQKYLDPVNFNRHAAAAKEAGQAYAGVNGFIDTLRKSTAEANINSARFHTTLSGLDSTLANLQGELEATRGKTVELGVTAKTTGSDLETGLGGGAKKTAAELKKAAREAEKLKKFWADLFPGVKEGITGAAPGIKLPPPTFELPPDLSQYGVKIKEGITGGLPGIEIPVTIPKLPTSPFADALKKDLAQIPAILLNAAISGDWLGAAMDIGSQLGSTIGKGIGTALGGKAGGLIGEALGSLVGPLIGKLFGDTEYEKRVKKAAEDFKMIQAEAIETAGSMDRLRHQFSLVGIEIDSAFKARDPAWLRQVLDEGYAKTQLLTSAMEEYGFTWDNLGAEGRALQLSDLLTDLKAKTDVLIGAGIDELSVLQKQEAQYEDLLVKAIATNTEIPLAMRPLLERMQELGLLTDEATGQFIDLGQVTWAKSLTQGFDQVTKAIYDLRDALTTGVGGALDDLGKRSVRIPIGFDVENPSKGIPALASGGIVRRPTLALVGESGPEAVVPLSSLGAASGGESTVILELDGRTLAEIAVPHIPGVVRRYVPA